MNKYIWLIILLVVIVAGGIIYRSFISSSESNPVTSGKVKEFTITAKKDTWSFVPEDIQVERGDKLILTIVNEDSYDHGLAIDAFGVSQRMPANQTIKIEFVATQAGDFPFYCSVPCGEGEVNGVKRGHFDMVWKIKVRDIVKTPQ